MADQDVLYRLKIDLSSAKPQFEEVRRDAAALGDIKPKIEFQNLGSLKAELTDLVKYRDNAFDFESAKAAQDDIRRVESEITKLNEELGNSEHESAGFFSQFKEGLSGIGSISIGTALGEGIKDIFSGFISKAKEADDASDSLRIALAKAGVSAADSKGQIATLGTAAEKIADDFAVPKLHVTELQAKIAGFGNVSGEQLNKLTEFSIGAANALQLPAEAVARLIAKSSDPEQAATLARLGIVFDKNATSAEKMTAIQAKLGPAVEATKESTRDAVGDFDRLKNTVEEAAIGFASESFEALQPVFQQLIPVVTSFGEVLTTGGKALSSVAGFILQHKTAVLTLVGAYATFKAVSAVNEAGGIVKIFSTGAAQAEQFAASIIGKIIPGYAAEAAAVGTSATAHGALAASETAEAAATAEASVAQAVLNAVMAVNPIFLLIGGIGALVGLYALFSGGTKELGEATKDASAALDDFNKATGETSKIDEQSKSLSDLSSKYDELSGKPNRTAAEQAELDKATSELAKSVPEAVDGFDSFSGQMTIATGRVRDFVKEQKNLSAEEKADALHTLADKTADLGNSYKDAQDKLAKLEAQQKLLEQNVNVPTGFLDGLKQAVGLGDSVEQKQKDVLHQIVAQREELQKAKPQLQENIKALESQGQSAQQVAEKLHLSVEEVTKLVPLQKEASEVTKQHVADVKALASAYDEAKKKQEDSLNAVKSAYNQAQLDYEQAKASGNKEQIAQAEADLANLKAQGLALTDQKKKYAKIAQKTDQDLNDVTQKEQQSQFQIRLKAIDADAKTRSAATKEVEANLNKVAADEFLAGSRKKAELTKTENSKVLKQEIGDITAQREALLKLAVTNEDGAIVSLQPKLSKKGHEAEDLANLKDKVATLTKALSQKQVELSTNIKGPSPEEISKFYADLASAINGAKLKEIEVGIRPKSDALEVIQDRLFRIQAELGLKQLQLISLDVSPDQFGKLQLEITKLYQDSLTAQKDYHDKSLELSTTLDNARIALITNDIDRERAGILQKIAADEEYFNRRRELGQTLTADEKELEQLQLAKHYQELLKLDKQYEQEKTANVRKYAEQGLNIIVDSLTKAYDTAKKLSAAEYDDKILGFDKEQGALNASFQRGEVGQREYSIKLAKINEERSKAEDEQNAQSVGKFIKGLATAYNTAISEAGKYFSELASKYFLDTALHNAAETSKLAATAVANSQQTALTTLDSAVHQSVETQKTLTTQVGVTQRIALYKEETLAALTTAQAKTGDAVATTVASGISLSGFLGVALAIAEGAAVSLAIQALINSISFKGFAKGGIIAGEGGQIELIQPAKEFAQFAGQLVTQVVMTTERSLSGRNQPGGSRTDSLDVNVSGKLTSRGRDVNYQLERDNISSRSERVLV